MPEPEYPTINVDAELGAMGFMMLALINTHPDKKALRATLDLLVSHVQLRTISGGVASSMPEPLRQALDKYYAQLDTCIDGESK
jgi:hypothetical protein